MDNHMKQDRQRTSYKRDANVRLPEYITSHICQEILNLPDTDRKTEYLKEVFLTKFVSKDTKPPQERKIAAIRKWLATERNNEATNDRLCFTPGDYNILPRVTFESFLEKAREIIEAIIGDIPDFDALAGGFSGGATTSKRRTESHPASKFLGQADITEEALPLWESLYATLEGWNQFSDQLNIRLVRGNVLFTVLKNANIDRVACKEPDLNMFMQKGLGNQIRQALRRNGVNLNDQSKNRNLARIGSADGSLATLDLSSASDSVSRELVFQLMPIHWFTTLDALRSKVTLIDGVEHANEMFSSMGNGFTFELESLLFYAITRATAYFRGIRGVISVYGDDLIVPTDLAHDVVWVLGYFGFETNESKSFITGSFRESCGGHFDNGRDITPFYLKAPISKLIDLIHVGNSLRHWAGVEDMSICDPQVYALWAWIRDLIPFSLLGGRELDSKTQLVTPHRPKKVLKPSKTRGSTGLGGYIHWLCATSNRKDLYDGVETSYKTDIVHMYKSVKAPRTVTRIHKFFLEELA